MEAFVARHQAIARATRAGVTAMGLDLWAESESIATACCTAVRTPVGISAEDIISTLRSRYGVMISGGYGDLRGKLFRLGHMGLSAHPTLAIAQLGLLEMTLTNLGLEVPRGAGVAAALERLGGWDDATQSYPH
jgi:pyridoxamine--pyruvate transaminase